MAVNESDKGYKDGSIMKFAGVLKGINAKKIKRYIYEGRKNGDRSKGE